ncbi:MAG: alanine racemase [Clostridia bacterium]
MQNLKRRTWAEIDLNCVEHNFDEIKNHCKTNICCVIKADAYGHGAVELAKEYEKLGASFFGVSNIDEALQLRKADIRLPILIFGYTPVTDAPVLADNNISQCVYSLEYANQLSEECVKQNVIVKIHIKVDTGMSRLGFYYQNPKEDFETIDEIRKASKLYGLFPEGIFTHFASSDLKDNTFTLKQLCNFNLVLNSVKDINFTLIHCANSGGTLDYENSRFDMVRAGIILYGLSPSDEVKNKLDLKPALSLKSVVSHVKKVKVGTSISYGRTFIADKDMIIATIAIGYADGYTRILSEKGAEVLVGGKRCKVVGRICMDQLMIDLNGDNSVKIGDIVTLIGSDLNETITAEEIANLRNTINYEVICDIGARVPRVYIKNNIEVAMLNYIG